MDSKNEVFEYLIDQLRQQVNNSQCEDLAHEVQSLKNQLRDASAQIKELHLALAQATGDVEAYKLIRKGWYGPEQSGCRKEDVQVENSWVEHDGAAACPVPDDTAVDIKFRNGEVESNTKALLWSWGTSGGPYEIVAYRVVKQQRRKEDAQECSHNWRFVGGKAPAVCVNCGVAKSDECEHKWEYYYPNGRRCAKCGAINV